MLTRRDVLRAAGAAGVTALPIPAFAASRPDKTQSGRVVFFLQCHGLSPVACVPKNASHGARVAQLDLPSHISALNPYRDKINIINGLHGRHTTPSHSAYYGALGGYKKSQKPTASTIDADLASLLPRCPIPNLCVGLDSLEKMRTRPVFSSLTATAAGKPVSMISNPDLLFDTIFRAAGNKKQQEEYNNITKSYEFIQEQAAKHNVGGSSRQLFEGYMDAYGDIQKSRKELVDISDRLKAFIPKYSELYEEAEFETQWHELIVENCTAALQAGVSNMVTIAAGSGEYYGSWKGLGIPKEGHQLGHMSQDNDTWEKIHGFNAKLLVKMIEKLAATPEGNGSMLDNTLIVYTSNNADKQHTDASNWPFLTIGSLGGRMKTNQYLDMKGRPINALYGTLLEAAGGGYRPFNLTARQCDELDKGNGPIVELLG